MNKEQAAAVFDGIREKVKWLDEHAQPLIEEMNPEAKKLRKPDVEAYVRYMLEQYPPEPFLMPDGEVIIASAWGLLLKHSEWTNDKGHKVSITNAKDWLRRLEGGLE